MKLLMENWREYVTEENERVILTEEELNELLQEIGALKSFMGRMRGGKKFGDHGYGWEAAVEQWEEEDAQKAAQSLGLSGVDTKEDFKAKVQDTIQRAEKSGDPRAKEAVAAITGKIEKTAPVEPPPVNGAAVAGPDGATAEPPPPGGPEVPPVEPPIPGGEEEEHVTSVPGAVVGQADKNELRMVASQLADPYGGGRLKGLKLSPEEMAGVRQFLGDWAKTMNIELMERLLYLFEEQRRGRLQRRAPAQQVAQAGLQPLDLTQIYDIIEDEEKAKLAAAMIAQSLENVGVRALNWREPPVRAEEEEEVETGAGEEEEEGILDKMSDLGDKLTGLVDQGMDSAKEAAEALSQGLDSEAVHNLEMGLDATMALGLTGYGEALATPAAIAALAIDVGQGDWESALWNVIALIPVAGKGLKVAAKGTKYAGVAGKAVKLAAKAGPLVQAAEKMKMTKGALAAADMAKLLSEKYNLNIAEWTETFDKVDTTLQKMANLPVIGEPIKQQLGKFEKEINQVRKAMGVTKGLTKGELPSKKGKDEEVPQFVAPPELTDPSRPIKPPAGANLQETQLKRWKELAGILHP